MVLKEDFEADVLVLGPDPLLVWLCDCVWAAVCIIYKMGIINIYFKRWCFRLEENIIWKLDGY